MPETVHVRTTFFLWLAAAGACGLFTALLWRRVPALRRLFAPEPQLPEVCDGVETLAVFVAYYLLPSLVHAFLLQAGVFARLLGPEHSSAMFETATPAVREALALRHQPWLMVPAAFVLSLLAYALARRHSARPLAHLGFPPHRIRDDLLLGLVVGVNGTAAANALHAGVSWLSLDVFQMRPEEHPLTQLAAQGLAPAEWAALAASAILAAPLIEELLFRGILQRRWALRRYGGDVAMGLALVMALLSRSRKIQAAWPATADLLVELQPACFVLAIVPGYVLVRCRAATPVPAALYATAALFAAVHSAVWPTPIPLFLLGLLLGFLAQQTQRLLAPLVVHMLFNAAACLVLFLSHG